MGAYANFTQFHESEFCFCLFLVAMSLLQVTGGGGGGGVDSNNSILRFC